MLRLDKAFLKTRQVFIWNDINSSLSRRVVQSLRYLSRSEEPVYLYIHSNGGFIDDAISIVDEIEGLKSLEIPVYTIAQGQAYSAAAIILSLGSPGCRYATPNSTVMLHDWSYDLASDYASQQRKTAEFFDLQALRMNKMVAEACRKNTPKKFKQFVDEIGKTIWLDASAAIKYGIIDGIWDWGWEREIVSAVDARNQ